MSAYLAIVVAVLSRILPHSFHLIGLNFTAVGGSLLFFGSKLTGTKRWQTISAVLALAATDYYLTVYAYGYTFHAADYVTTWAWYAAICLLGSGLLAGRASAMRVTVGVLASSTSFFLLSNFMVWAGSTMYAHSAAGLGACYVAAVPFYANDLISTALTAAAFFGLPALAKDIAASVRELQTARNPIA